MKMIVNASTLRGYGSRTVGMNIITELIKLIPDRGIELEAWIPKEWGWTEDELEPRVKFHNCNRGIVPKIFLENVSLPFRFHRNMPDCLFSLGDTSVPSAKIPNLLLVQQSYLARDLDKLDFSIPRVMKLKMVLMQKYFQVAIPNVSAFTVQTFFMKKWLMERWGISTERIIVVPSAVKVKLNEKKIERKNSRDYICFIASPGPHKNFLVLAYMMYILKQRGYDIQCKLTTQPAFVPEMVSQARLLGVLECFDFIGTVTHEDALNLMHSSLGLVMPSKMESFGLPYYEAMAMGCPVVAADTACAREACADSGLYAAADSGEEFAEHIIRLCESASYWKSISNAAQQRYCNIESSWQEVAHKYLLILDKIKDDKS